MRGDRLAPRSNYLHAIDLMDCGSERDVEQAKVYAMLAIADELCHLAMMLRDEKVA